MGAMQRTKGATAERVVARLIREWLGLDVRRNWQAQSAAGGADLTGIPGWQIEIKRAKEFLTTGGHRQKSKRQPGAPPRS